MVRRLLGDVHAFTTYDVARDEPPAIPETQDAYVITGSPAGVYDGLPWLMSLIEWLREAKGRTKLVGICFGHQVMAQAFGGHVAKADTGRGTRLPRYHVPERAPCTDDAPTSPPPPPPPAPPPP